MPGFASMISIKLDCQGMDGAALTETSWDNELVMDASLKVLPQTFYKMELN